MFQTILNVLTLNQISEYMQISKNPYIPIVIFIFAIIIPIIIVIRNNEVGSGIPIIPKKNIDLILIIIVELGVLNIVKGYTSHGLTGIIFRLIFILGLLFFMSARFYMMRTATIFDYIKYTYKITSRHDIFPPLFVQLLLLNALVFIVRLIR